MKRFLCLCLLTTALGFVSFPAGRADDPATAAAPSSPPAPGSVANWLAKAAQDFEDGKLDDAAREATAALVKDPKNIEALDLRASIYTQRKFWDLAERDYAQLNQLNPDPAYQYKLGQLKFLQRDYSNARPHFAALKGDERLGDLAAWKVFLCDMLGGHDAVAAKDIAALDATPTKPANLYCRAAWFLYHGDRQAANRLFALGEKTYGATVADLYLKGLMEAQRFTPDLATFTTKDARTFTRARVVFESKGLRTLGPQGWITVPLDQLPDDLSPFPEAIREQIVHGRAKAVARASESTEHPAVSFTTRSGVTYQDVRWSLTDDGLRVITPEGWKLVPFDQLPADLSSFPVSLRDGIQDRQKRAEESGARSAMLTFTTRDGRTFSQARTKLGVDALLVLTPNGWMSVPFRDLNADLSAFPADWRDPIRIGAQAADRDITSQRNVTFTTRHGHEFSDVRAALGSDGLRVLTSYGWIVLPYADLPTDLSPFPPAWRDSIIERQKSAKPKK